MRLLSGSRAFEHIGSAALVAGAATVTVPSAALAATPTYSYASDADNYLGQGASERFSAPAYDFELQSIPGNRSIRFLVLGTPNGPYGPGLVWEVVFVPPEGENLHEGHYADATDNPFADPSVAELRVDGEGRGCGTTHGDFTIQTLTYDAAGTPTHLAATLTSHCDFPDGPAYTASVSY
ncbi:hypothetical protein ACWEOE_38695 [Amycolatopsis sp. NPDC004368]